MKKKKYSRPLILSIGVENEGGILVASEERNITGEIKEEWKEEIHEYEFEW